MATDAAALADRRPLRGEDIFALRFLADVAVSPDGLRIACVERRVDERLDAVRSQVLVVSVADGSAAAELESVGPWPTSGFSVGS